MADEPASVELEAPGDAPSGEDSDAPLAVFSNVSKTYGDVHALGPIDLTVEGRCVGILGPNGSGKTTFLRLLMGLIRPTTGSISVLGRPAGEDSLASIGYVPQGAAMFPGQTGLQAVETAGRLSRMRSDDAAQRAHQVLDYVGLGEERHRAASTYSTGMRQRLKIAQALVHDPDILVIDEPTEGVDPTARRHILDLLDELSRVHGIRILVSTHVLADVERLATNVIVLNAGKVAVQGPLDALRRPATRSYSLRVEGDVRDLTRVLDENGVGWRSMEPDIIIESDDAVAVLKYVAEAGTVVRHLAPTEISLEEAFLSAVGGAHA